jgi:6-phosphogluconate dehydrogenase
MARRLTKGGHQCVVFDRNRENVNALAKEGPAPAYSLEELVEKLSAPRAVWVMLPSGAPTEETVVALSKLLESGDAITDGGNSFYKDDVHRSAMLKPSGIHYLDVGTSGGVLGLERGYCLMIGGDEARGPGSKSAEIYFSVLYARSTPEFRLPFPVTLYLSPNLRRADLRS